MFEAQGTLSVGSTRRGPAWLSPPRIGGVTSSPFDPRRPDDEQSSAVLLRNGRSRALAWFTLAVAVLAAALTLLQVPQPAAVAVLGLPALLGVLSWACYLRPHVELRADGLTLVNIARTVVIPFSRIDEFDLRLGLTVRSTGGKAYGAWALPSSGRRTQRERLGKVSVEAHVPAEIQQILDAHARWRQQDTPVSGQVTVTSTLTPLPPALLVLSLAWAVWGLRVVATL
jgi:hypothetical protein